ncbi:MAG: hypothetical protein V1738_03740, partial [Patescibacteria group bacterium]
MFSHLPLRDLSVDQRLSLLRERGLLTGDVETGFQLLGNRTALEISDQFAPYSENVIGIMPLPLGLATNFIVNDGPVLVPMAIEESTIIAGASKAAKLCWPDGFKVLVHEDNIIRGQVLFSGFESKESVAVICGEIRQQLDGLVAEISQATKRSGHHTVTGCYANLIRFDHRGVPMIEVTLVVHTHESMGAATVTKIAERVAEALEPITGRRRVVAICNNHLAGRLVEARAKWPQSAFPDGTLEKIMDAYLWART